TLVLRTDLSGDPSFRELLARVRETALGAFSHQDLPFERLVEAIEPERHLGRHPLFQAMLVLQNAPFPPIPVEGLSMTPPPLDPGSSRIDFLLALSEAEDGSLSGSLEYDTDLFERASARRMLDQLERILRAAALDPSRRLSEMPLLGEKEEAEIRSSERGLATTAPIETPESLFEAVARRAPDRVALSSDPRSLRYGGP